MFQHKLRHSGLTLPRPYPRKRDSIALRTAGRRARALSGLTTTRSNRWVTPLLESLGPAAGDVGTVYAAAMDKPDPPETNETEAERQRRLAWERERIAEADADIAAGLIIDAAEIDAWIDSIGTDQELPPPQVRR